MKTVSWHRRVGVWIGIGTGPGVLMVGGGLASQLSVPLLTLAIPLGAVCLTALAVGEGFISWRRRERVAERAEGTFGGAIGGDLFNLVIALGTAGWLSFYLSMVAFAWGTHLGFPIWASSLIMACGMLALSYVGIDRWNLLIVLTGLSTLGVAAFALLAVEPAPVSPSTDATLSGLLWGVGSVVSVGVLFAARTGDFTADLESASDVIKVGLGLLAPLVVFLSIGSFAYRTLGDWNLADLLARAQSPLVGNIFLLIASVANVLGAFHSGTLAIDNLTPLNKRWGAAVMALVGFAVGATRFDRQLLLFLDVLGAVVPSALIVMLAAAVVRGRVARWIALASWGLGAAAALILQTEDYLFHMFAGVSISLLVLLIGHWFTALRYSEGQEA